DPQPLRDPLALPDPPLLHLQPALARATDRTAVLRRLRVDHQQLVGRRRPAGDGGERAVAAPKPRPVRAAHPTAPACPVGAASAAKTPSTLATLGRGWLRRSTL